MTMVLDCTIQSLAEYLRVRKEQQDADQQEPSFKRKHKYLVPERPTECPSCSAKESFWVKAYFFRWAVEADLEAVLPVPRYICNRCSLVISVSFAFLVPYCQFTASAVAKAAQGYLAGKTTYREVAEAVSGNSDELQRPNHSQVWHWVDALTTKAATRLNARLQRACINAGKEDCLAGIHEIACPNAYKAGSQTKVHNLNCGTRLLSLAHTLLQCSENGVESLQTHFANFVEPALSILTGRGVRLFTPQSSQHIIW